LLRRVDRRPTIPWSSPRGQAAPPISKLAVLVPRPHKNLVVYHGVLAANATWRSRVVVYGRKGVPGVGGEVEDAPASNAPRYLRRQWAELMRRSFGFDVLSCPDCGGKMRLLAVILDRAVIRKILSPHRSAQRTTNAHGCASATGTRPAV
jgi:hypothetical protein